MKELVDALAFIEHGSTRLDHLIGEVMQDGQHSHIARAMGIVLGKYVAEYGTRTVSEIRALYAIQQMEECLSNDDPNTAISGMELLSKAYNTLPLASPLREEAKALWDKARVKWT
jgi:hypothetical protein